jgi:MFS family permease
VARSRVLVDLGPLRKFPQFRLLWSGYVVSSLGNQLTVVAVPYQIFRITHSSLDVGLVSLAQLVPLLAGSLVGGTVADRMDRRRLLLVSQSLLASTSVGLALNAGSAHPALWPLFVCSACQAGFSGVDGPTRAAIVVSTVDRESVVGANALWQVLYQLAQIGGPAVAGVLLARFGVRPVYWFDVVSFGASLACISRLERVPPSRSKADHEPWLSEVAGGLRYLRGHQVLQATFLVDLNAMVFGMPRALFPALGLVRFHGGAGAVGLLYAAPGVGALVGAVSTGWVAAIRRQGLAVLVAVGVWGVSITAFGLVPSFAAALALLALAGGADVVSAVFRSTILQLDAPDELLGRLQAVQTAVVTGGPRLGDLEAGAVASLAGTEVSVVSGGLACLVGLAVLSRRLPRFARFERGASGAADARAEQCGPGEDRCGGVEG